MGKNYTYKPGDPFPFQYKYEHMGVTTDCVIFTYEDWQLKVLLVRRGGEPYMGEWAFPGGFLRMDETAEQGALRELREETALVPSAIGQLGVFSDVDRDPRERVITIAWYALVKPHEVVGGDDAAEAAWFPIDNLPPLAFDHEKIFEAAKERLRRDIHFQPVGFDLLDDEFTIPDLQRLYEAILGVKFDRRNFQRKILASGILESAGKDETEDYLFCDSEWVPGANFEKHRHKAYSFFAEDSTMPSPPTSCSPETTAPKKGRQGRRGILFRLNRKKYKEMKDDGGKIEF